jgi:hypothetical protein
MALRKFGSAHELEKKLQAKNKRRANKMEKDRQNRLEEQERRKQAAEAAVKERVATAQAKKQAALERKRKAEEQVRDAESWQKLVATAVGNDEDPSEIQKLIDDAMAWRQHCAGGHDKEPMCKKRKESSSSMNFFFPNNM